MSIAAEPTTRAWPAIAAPLATGCCLAGAAAYVALQDPTQGGAFLPCPFRVTTGLWCPGCGLTRATHFLLNGDVTSALRHHLFVLPVLAAIVVVWLRWTVRAAGRPLRTLVLPPWAVAGLLALAIGFAVVRNLPFVGGLRG